MARGKSTQPRPANLSPTQMLDAIPRIDRRIADLEAFDPFEISERNDPRIISLCDKLDALLVGLFGNDTIEYDRYQSIAILDTAGFDMYGDMPRRELVGNLSANKLAAIHRLREIKGLFLEEVGSPKGGKALKAYDGLELHPAISRATDKLYRDGHYANAVADSVKALNNLVRLHSGVEDRDGSSLMEYVFNPTKPILKFNALADQSDRDEQKGFMMMFSGSVSGLRNPRAHKFVQDDPERALEFIAFVSLLAKLADNATK